MKWTVWTSGWFHVLAQCQVLWRKLTVNVSQLFCENYEGNSVELSISTTHTIWQMMGQLPTSGLWYCSQTYLDVKVTVEALDQHDEGAGEVVPQRWRIDRHTGILRMGTDQEALRTLNQWRYKQSAKNQLKISFNRLLFQSTSTKESQQHHLLKERYINKSLEGKVQRKMDNSNNKILIFTSMHLI